MDPAASLLVGTVGRPHGIRGEVHVRLFNPGSDVLTRVDELTVGQRRLKVRARRPSPDGALITFEGIDSREAAAALGLAEVRVPRAALPSLAPGEFYVEDLPGCLVIRDDGQTLGTVRGVFWNGAQDVMTVTGARGEHLIPVVPAHVVAVEVGARRVTVHWDAPHEDASVPDDGGPGGQAGRPAGDDGGDEERAAPADEAAGGEGSDGSDGEEPPSR